MQQQKGKIHKVQHSIKNYQTCKETGNYKQNEKKIQPLKTDQEMIQMRIQTSTLKVITVLQMLKRLEENLSRDMKDL